MAQETFHLDDLAHLAKRLPHNILGRYEPVTGLTVLNISKAGHLEALRRFGEKRVKESDLLLIRTLNHETCHFTQCLCSGYFGYRNRVLWRALNSWRNHLIKLRFFWFNVKGIGRHQILKLVYGRKDDGRRRSAQMARFMYEHNKMVLIQKITNGNPNSIARLEIPRFFRVLDAFRDREMEKGPDGVSTYGIAEGAAVAFCALMEPQERSPDAFAKRMEKDLATMPPEYAELWTLLVQKAPQRAFEFILPLAALALCYKRPHFAIGPMLERLLQTEPGTAYEAARALFNAPPKLKSAGRVQKSAQKYRDHRRRASMYDTFIDRLKDDPAGFDDFTILTDPNYLNTVETLPICLQFSDGKSADAFMSNADRAARIAVASLTMEVRSRGRDRRDGEKYMVQWARSVFDRTF